MMWNQTIYELLAHSNPAVDLAVAGSIFSPLAPLASTVVVIIIWAALVLYVSMVNGVWQPGAYGALIVVAYLSLATQAAPFSWVAYAGIVILAFLVGFRLVDALFGGGVEV